MGQHVVHLARDAGAFVAARLGDAQLLLGLGALGALLEGPDQLASRADVEAPAQDARGDHDVDDQVDPPRVAVVGLHRGEDLADHDVGQRDRPADLPVDPPGGQGDGRQHGRAGGESRDSRSAPSSPARRERPAAPPARRARARPRRARCRRPARSPCRWSGDRRQPDRADRRPSRAAARTRPTASPADARRRGSDGPCGQARTVVRRRAAAGVGAGTPTLVGRADAEGRCPASGWLARWPA